MNHDIASERKNGASILQQRGEENGLTTMTNRASRPEFISVSLAPWRKGEPENHIVVSTAAIERVAPPIQLSERTYNADGTTRTFNVTILDPRYSVSVRLGGRLEYGHASGADLLAAGVRLPDCLHAGIT